MAYLGGSITAANGWRPKTTAWLKKTYPNATFKEINAAIGGTGSDLGVFRVGHDVLEQPRPALCRVRRERRRRAEPAKIWRCDGGHRAADLARTAPTDIVFAYTITGNDQGATLKQGNCPRSASAMELLADFYGIPSVNFAVPGGRADRPRANWCSRPTSSPAASRLGSPTGSCHPPNKATESTSADGRSAHAELKDSRPVDHRPSWRKPLWRTIGRPPR